LENIYTKENKTPAKPELNHSSLVDEFGLRVAESMRKVKFTKGIVAFGI
jgi:hypothetical protein